MEFLRDDWSIAYICLLEQVQDGFVGVFFDFGKQQLCVK